MANCLISFGANLGDPRKTIGRAAERLKEGLVSRHHSGSFQLSRLYNTPPVGGPLGQPPFINAVAAVETRLSPWEVWQVIRDTESLLGRERYLRWEARAIDLDILLYDEQTIWTPHFKVPHPRMCMRRFILAPAAEVADGWREPISGLTVGELARRVAKGRANVLVCSTHASAPEVLLSEVARTAYADLVSPQADSPVKDARRWVAYHPLNIVAGTSPTLRGWPALELRELEAVVRDRNAKLLVVMLDRPSDTSAAWEDVYRPLATQLGFASDSSALASAHPQPEYRFAEPCARYLLPPDDPAWAMHELVAALEAMDCPVEPITDPG